MNSKDLVKKMKSGGDITADMQTIANQKPAVQNTAAVKPSGGVSNPNSNAKLLTRMQKNGQDIAPSMKLAAHGTQLSPYSVKAPQTDSEDPLWKAAYAVAEKRNTKTPAAGSSGDPLWDAAYAVAEREYEQAKSNTANAPAPWTSQYTDKINKTLDKIENRKPFEFSYDVTGDALYQQYKDAYTRNAGQAMNDTLGKTAALTGGYGNSYAAAAAQQAYNSQMDGLNDVIPELYQAAYNRANTEYDREMTELYRQLAAYGDFENTDYSRYRDTVADDQWNKNFAEDKRRYDQNYAEDKRRYDTDFAENQRQFNSSLAEDVRQADNNILYNYARLDEDKRQYDTNFAEDARRYDQDFAEDKRRYDTNLAEDIRRNDRDYNYQVERDTVSDSQWQDNLDFQKIVYGDEKAQKEREYALSVNKLAAQMAEQEAGNKIRDYYNLDEMKGLDSILNSETGYVGRYNSAKTVAEKDNIAKAAWKLVKSTIGNIDLETRADAYVSAFPDYIIVYDEKSEEYVPKKIENDFVGPRYYNP